MKLNQLREILTSEEVCVFHNDRPYNFVSEVDSESNNYVSHYDENISMWEKFGECEIEQMYDGITIDLK